MKKTIFGAIAVATAFMGIAFMGTANAADLSRGPAPYYPAPVGVYNWAGFYAGLNGGYEWGSISNSGLDPDGFVGGLQAGYNWQVGGFVFGGETDIQLTGAEDTFAAHKFSNPWFGTLRARAGFALNNILAYGTFGLAYGGLNSELLGFDEEQTHVGWTAGLGLEVGLTNHWSAKAEYLYIDLGERSYSTTGADHGLESSLLRFGVNYHF